MSSTDLTTRPVADLTEKMEWSRAMAPATLLPKQYQGQPGNLLFAVEYADALGIERINAITSIHVIEGKPTASAELIAGLVRRAGHRLRVSGDDAHAVAQIIRADDPEFVYEATWTLDRAQAAGLTGKAVWKNYPAAMLRARAITEVARMGASDALLGVVYTPEELGAEVDALGAPVKAAPPTPPASGADRVRAALRPEPPTTPAPAEDVQDAEVVETPVREPITPSQLKALHASLKDAGLGGADKRDEALALYSRLACREVTSSKDLSRDEASWVIDALKERATSAAQPDGEPEQPALGDAEWPPVAEPGSAS